MRVYARTNRRPKCAVPCRIRNPLHRNQPRPGDGPNAEILHRMRSLKVRPVPLAAVDEIGKIPPNAPRTGLASRFAPLHRPYHTAAPVKRTPPASRDSQ
jgi:hypothetical protein